MLGLVGHMTQQKKCQKAIKIKEIYGGVFEWIFFSPSTMASPAVLSLIFSLLIAVSHGPGASAEKVDVTLYYESLCPYCRSFITNQLADLFNSGLINIVNLKLVPWGNAQFLQNNKTILCQHGEDECYLNTIHACAINIWPDPKKHFRFIECVESGSNEAEEPQWVRVWKGCSQSLGFNENLIHKCYATGLGRKLSLQYAAQTDHLNPQHRFVPWVTLNGQPLYDDYENVAAYICKAYKGKPTAKACVPKFSYGANKEEVLTNRTSYNSKDLKGCKA